MSLLPTVPERLARARADLRMGGGVVICGGGPGLLVIAAEVVRPDRLSAMREIGQVALALTARRAETLKIAAYDGDIARLPLPADASLAWVRAMADPADDLRFPMKGPLRAEREGDASLHRAAIHLAKDAQLLPAMLVVPIKDTTAFAKTHDLTRLDPEATRQMVEAGVSLAPVVHARLPLTVSNAGNLHVFRPADGSVEHYAVEIGQPDRNAPVLTRLHSACFTGDVIGSLKCDCGPQLRAALGQMGAEGSGVLLYLNQEGRGIGLANKMRAYSLQNEGFDTVEANHRLGFEDDERDFRIGAEILKALGFNAVRLMTNNPAKVAKMEEMGISVADRVPLKVGQTAENEAYLATKAAKSGHLL